MSGKCIDYSFARPSPAAIAAAGYTGVIRYLSTDQTKNLSVAEAESLHAAGLNIILVWETTANASLGGAAQGAVDGAAAVAQAQALGYPENAHLLVNLGDFTGGDIGTIQDYYYAFRRVPGFTYEYGGYATGWKIMQLAQMGAVGLWWQNAMDDGNVNGSTVVPQASIYQRVTPTETIAGSAAGDYDEDVYDIGPDTVVWWTPTVTPTPTPAPAPEPTTKTIESVTVNFSDGTNQVVSP